MRQELGERPGPDSASSLEAIKRHERCPHHWMIGSSNGPASLGRCRECGLTRRFSNALEGVSVEKYKKRIIGIGDSKDFRDFGTVLTT